MKALSLIILLFCACVSINAQQTDNVYKLYLKNGSVIVCDDIKYTNNGEMHAIVKGRDNIVLHTDDIIKIEKDERKVESLAQTNYAPSGLKLFFTTTAAAGNVYYLTIGGIVGAQFCSHFFVGAGASIGVSDKIRREYDYDYYNGRDGQEDALFVPIYGCVRYNIINKKVTPFIDIKVGGDVTENSTYYSSFNVGCRIKLDRIALCPSVGADFRGVQINPRYHNICPNEIGTAGSVAVSFAIEF